MRQESFLLKVDQELSGKDREMGASDSYRQENTIKIEQRGRENDGREG